MLSTDDKEREHPQTQKLLVWFIFSLQVHPWVEYSRIIRSTIVSFRLFQEQKSSSPIALLFFDWNAVVIIKDYIFRDISILHVHQVQFALARVLPSYGLAIPSPRRRGAVWNKSLHGLQRHLQRSFIIIILEAVNVRKNLTCPFNYK